MRFPEPIAEGGGFLLHLGGVNR